MNSIPIEILGDSRLEINEDEYDISTNLQNVFTGKTEKPLKKLNDVDRVMYQSILKSPNYNGFIPRPGEVESGRF